MLLFLAQSCPESPICAVSLHAVVTLREACLRPGLLSLACVPARCGGRRAQERPPCGKPSFVLRPPRWAVLKPREPPPPAWGQEPAVGRRASGTSNVGVTGAGEGGGEGGSRAGPPRMRPPGHRNVTGTGGKGGASRPTSTCLSLAKRHCVKLPGRRPHARPPSPGPPQGNHLHRVPAPAPPKSQQSVTDEALPPSPREGARGRLRPEADASTALCRRQRLLHSGCAHRPWAGLAQNRSTERFVLNLESTYGSFIESPGCPCFPSGNGGPRYEHRSSGGVALDAVLAKPPAGLSPGAAVPAPREPPTPCCWGYGVSSRGHRPSYVSPGSLPSGGRGDAENSQSVMACLLGDQLPAPHQEPPRVTSCGRTRLLVVLSPRGS